jgi:hypothetical protein
MTRDEILQSAITAVCTERNDEYGEPEQNFEAIAAYWSNYLSYALDRDTLLCSRDVAHMMILFKVARLTTGKLTQDSYIDIAGYAACGGELA